MNINTDTLLKIITPKSDDIKVKIEKLSVDGKVDLSILKKDKGIESLLLNLFKSVSFGTKSKEDVAMLLGNNKQTFILKDLSSNIKNIVKYLEDSNTQNSKIKNQIEVLKNSLIDIKNINQKDIKNNIQNGGIFLESKLSIVNKKELLENNTSIIKNLQSDIKTSILQIQEHIELLKEPIPKELKVTIQKIIEQIEYYQLLSYVTNSNYTYLNFIEENLEDADINITSKKDDMSCQINLKLKDYGDIKVLLILENKINLNLNISIGIENSIFKKIVQNNLQKLRISLNNAGVIVQNINIFDIADNKDNPYTKENNINFGLDMKV